MHIEHIKKLQTSTSLFNELKEAVVKALDDYDFTHTTNFSVSIEDFLKEAVADAPPITIKISPTAYLKTLKLVQSFDKEIAWHGIVEKTDNTYLITDIIVYPQQVSGATVDANEETYGNWLMDQGENINHIRMQGHSHVNMAVNPSGTDTTYYKDLLEHVNDYYIFMIVNKKQEVHLRFYDMMNNLLYINIPISIDLPDSLDLGVWYDEELKNISTKVYSSYSKTIPKTYSQPAMTLAEADEQYEAYNRWFR